MGQKINFYGVVVSIWTNGFFRKMDNKGEEEVENYVCFLSYRYFDAGALYINRQLWGKCGEKLDN